MKRVLAGSIFSIVETKPGSAARPARNPERHSENCPMGRLCARLHPLVTFPVLLESACCTV
jgi:hypothetical protein